jgi:hypothetical protein
MVHYSIYGSLPRYVEQLTHSQQNLDESLAIKFSNPSLESARYYITKALPLYFSPLAYRLWAPVY